MMTILDIYKRVETMIPNDTKKIIRKAISSMKIDEIA